MKSIITYLYLFLISFSQFAQPNEKREEKIRNLRIAFLSTKLDLTTEEAQKFWPLFNKFDDKHTEFFKQKKQMMQALRKSENENISEKELQNLLNNSEDVENKLQENRKIFIKSLQGIIPTQKIILLRKLEEDFKQKLLQQFKNRRMPPKD